MKSKVYVDFPKAGLGNKLLTWSRAYVFAQLNDLEMHTSPWFSLFLGAWFRGESNKRIYLGYFKKASFATSIWFLFYRLIFKKIEEPTIEKLKASDTKRLFVFNKIFREYDFYKEIRPHKSLVKQGLFNMLSPSIKEDYEKAEKPVIGIHIRRGDFKITKNITPLGFFIEVINCIRQKTGKILPVTVFTDADIEEIELLFDLPNIELAKTKADIIDILLLADSKFLLTSLNSTFSYWSAFLSENVIIKPSTEWHVPFRSEDDLFFAKEIKWSGLPITAETDIVIQSSPGN